MRRTRNPKKGNHYLYCAGQQSLWSLTEDGTVKFFLYRDMKYAGATRSKPEEIHWAQVVAARDDVLVEVKTRDGKEVAVIAPTAARKALAQA